MLALRESRRGRLWAEAMRPGTLRVALQNYLLLSPSIFFLNVSLIGFGRRRKGQSSKCFRAMCEYQGFERSNAPGRAKNPRQEGSKTSQGRPRTLQDGSRWPQDGPREPQDGAKLAQVSPKMAQDNPWTPQGDPRWPQGGPRRAQGGPKMAPKGPKMAPRGPQREP